jgi:hypothetical protein
MISLELMIHIIDKDQLVHVRPEGAGPKYVSGTPAPIDGVGATSRAKTDDDTPGMIKSINPSVAITSIFNPFKRK